jgi:spore coat polysaccharide biosynthesis protein SpsF (cytidylyltransferase family)
MIVAAVQARMGSTRYPHKVLAEVVGKPMLWHIVNRLGFAHRVDQVVLSTSDKPSDEPIRAFAKSYEIPCFAGSELDLIDRLYRTAKYFGAHALVRITGDCPLIDPSVVDKVVASYITHSDNMDYVTNILPPTYPDGLDTEVYPATTLERLWKEIEDPLWREWFPKYLWEHEKEFRIHNVKHSEDLSHLRWTVDYEEDLIFVQEVYRRLYTNGRPFLMQDVLDLLNHEPHLGRINAGHNRNEGYLSQTTTDKS